MSDRPKEPARTKEMGVRRLYHGSTARVRGDGPFRRETKRAGGTEHASADKSSSSSRRSLSIMSWLTSVTGKSLCGQVGKCELMVRS